jgi:hypothetical protein
MQAQSRHDASRGRSKLLPEVYASQNDAGWLSFELGIQEFLLRSRFYSAPQSRELLLSLGQRHALDAFKIIHRIGADGAIDFHLIVHHRKANDHPIGVESMKITRVRDICRVPLCKRQSRVVARSNQKQVKSKL